MRAEKDFYQMNTSRQTENTPEYLGALLEGERRLVLVPMDPNEPWAAFRRMRSWMRETKAKAELDVFAAPQPLEQTAKVIPLRKKDSQQ